MWIMIYMIILFIHNFKLYLIFKYLEWNLSVKELYSLLHILFLLYIFSFSSSSVWSTGTQTDIGRERIISEWVSA